MTRAKPAVQMACVSIDYQDFLLPADKAMKVLALMQEAAKCDHRYRERTEVFEVGEEPLRLALKLINADQIRMPIGTMPADAPRRLR